MTERENLEEEVYRLKCRRDNIEDKRRQVMRIWEEEDDNMLHAYRKLENNWESYGKQDVEFASLLEEEKAFIDKHREKLADYGEQIHNEFEQELEDIDREVDEKQLQIYYLSESEEKGEE